MTRARWAAAVGMITLACLGPAGPAPAAGSPRVHSLRTQRVGDATYFHVRFEAPGGLVLPRLDNQRPGGARYRSALAQLPRLVPQDDKARAVYLRLVLKTEGRRPSGPARLTVPGLEFVGKAAATGAARFLLLYPTGAKPNEADRRGRAAPRGWLPQTTWAQVPVTLDFARATTVTTRRDGDREPADDLEGLWASAQAARFAVLEAQASGFGFYGYAREATGRKYRVAAPALEPAGDRGDRPEARLYDTTAGAGSVAEALAVRRPRTGEGGGRAGRTIDLGDVEGIPAAPMPWREKIPDRKPADEPLARLVPQDNYYVYFRNIGKLIDLGDRLDEWVTPLALALGETGRDYRVKQRLERQLCVRADVIGKTLGPYVIRGVALTGSDVYLREGSDVTLILYALNRDVVLAANDRFIREARRRFGKELREGKEEYHKVKIETYVTPLREVSLYRAAFDDYVVQSNSPAGLRRVIDAYQGRLPRLTEAPDFQQVRSIFPPKDKSEDGLVFFSDAFLRRLMGPAGKIKEKRRREALAGLYRTTYAALFHAWETGKLPADQAAALAGAGLKEEDLAGPRGGGPTWDARRQVAVSKVYNTLDFVTPLIELPIDKVTEDEARGYEQFRRGYLARWRHCLDPVGARITLDRERLRVEACVLPLAEGSVYAGLRRYIGSGTVPADGSSFGANTLVQLTAHVSRAVSEERLQRRNLRRARRGRPPVVLGRSLRAWLDDSPAVAGLIGAAIRHDLEPRPADEDDLVRLLARVPLTAAVEVRRPLLFAGLLEGLKVAVSQLAPDVRWEPQDRLYRGARIGRLQLPAGLFTGRQAEEDRPGLALYYTLVPGDFFVSLSEPALQDLIDGRVPHGEADRNEGRARPVEVNASLLVSPGALSPRTREALRLFLGWKTGRGALTAEPLLYALYHPGLLAADAPPRQVQAAARRLLGFVPVSPDGTAFVYDRKTDEVTNRRHGSFREPRLDEAVEKNSAMGRLLERYRGIRADLRFKEDGVHWTVTVERQPSER